MNLEEKVRSLEKVCEEFLAGPQDFLPRVMRRHMQPVLDALKELAQGTGDPVKIQTIFQYPIRQGVRGKEEEPADALGVIGYKLDSNEFVWKIVPAVMTPAGIVFVALINSDGQQYRIVSIEDVIELGISPSEIVSFVKTIAGRVAMDQAQSQATQKPATA